MLEIICRFQLTVQHRIFFQPHKCGIRIRLGITVPVTAHMELLYVFFQLPYVYLQLFYRLLECCFSLAGPMYKDDPLVLFDGIQFLP